MDMAVGLSLTSTGQPLPFSLLQTSSTIGKKTAKQMIFLTVVLMVFDAVAFNALVFRGNCLNNIACTQTCMCSDFKKRLLPSKKAQALRLDPVLFE